MSRILRKYRDSLIPFVFLIFLTTGCGMAPPAEKPDIGPTGKAVESKPNPPLAQRLISPPNQLYDMEAVAGTTFEGISKKNWSEAQSGTTQLQQIWMQAKSLIGEKKGVKETEEALNQLVVSVSGQKDEDAYEALNNVMAGIGEIAKSYKLSPLSDLILTDNSIRNVSFYVENNDWKKAVPKMKELEGVWHQTKPSIEQVGILGEITKTHAIILQMKDAVEGQNKNSFQDQVANINESLNKIRRFYYGR